jgi:2-polyprenyl-3-methyl-5-hydroxy-6-metoxy-1,4-benzoquinol methylase
MTIHGTRFHIILSEMYSYVIQLSKSRYVKRSRPYYRDLARGLYGAKPFDRQRRSPDFVISKAAGLTVLDLGCAEGLVAGLFLEAGAAFVHGIDIKTARIEAARKLFGDHPNARFDVGDIARWDHFRRHVGCLPSYDIVLMLGVYHFLPMHSRAITLRGALALSRRWFVLRTDRRLRDEATEVIFAGGFRRVIPAGSDPDLAFRFFERTGAGVGRDNDIEFSSVFDANTVAPETGSSEA